MSDERTLTQDGFALLLKWLDTNRDEAARKYELIRARLIRVFIGRGCYEPELLADLTFDRVTRKLPELNGNYVGEPAAYFHGVANKIHLEWLRRQGRERKLAEDVPREPKLSNDDREQREAEIRCLEECLSKLSEGARDMILEYYRDEKTAKIQRRRRLAESLGVSAGALQIRASRIRARLQECVRDCLAPVIATEA